MDLGNKIIKLRKREKLSQESLADKLNVTRQTISNWELNITKPDINQIKKISKIFNISIDELLENELKSNDKKKVVSNENNSTKRNINIRKICITIYFIILLFILLFIIYCFTNKDFTKRYQTEIICTINDTDYFLSIEEENDNYLIVVSTYNMLEHNYQVEEKLKAGTSASTAIDSIHKTKKALIAEGAICK